MIHFITVFLIAIGLSMDAFSLAILYGTLNFERKKTIVLSIFVGVFHFFMPLLGNLIGVFILNTLSIKPNLVVGAIFLVIAIQMIVSMFKEEEIVDLKSVGAMAFFAFTVSIDSFSVGIGLPAVCDNQLLAVSIFSVTSFIFTFMGLTIGSKLNNRYGKVSTFIGGMILLLLSLYYLFF